MHDARKLGSSNFALWRFKMSHGGWKLFFFMTMRRAVWFVLPHKYPVRGTKVRIDSYTHRYKHRNPSPIFNGTVVGPEHRFAGPFEQKYGYAREGVYLRGDPRWEQNWVVQLDDGLGTLEQQQLAPEEMISGYRWGIPFLQWLVSPDMRGGIFRRERRVSDLPYEIDFYDGDYVVHADDPGKAPRMVTSFWFGKDGKLSYSLAETRAERKATQDAEIEKAKRTGRAYGTISGPTLKYHLVPGSLLTLVRRGNSYQVACGKPEDLSFPHLIIEVDFWKDLGEWSEDRSELSLDEARKALKEGRIDTLNPGRSLKYHQIVLPERFAKFRERSRKAALEYLDKFPDKYAFDVVPTEVREEYEQTDF